MFIININGGLGNQLFQYAVAKKFLTTTDMQVKLDLHNYGLNSYRNYSLDQINSKVEIASTTEINNLLPFYYKNNEFTTKVIHKFFRKQLVDFYKNKGLIKFERECYKPDISLFSIKKDVLLIGYWQNEKYFLDIRQQLLEDIQLKDQPSAIYNAYLNKIRSSNSVSVHIRRCDYLTHTEYQNLSIEYYQKAFEYIGNHINNPTFYIFSDDLDWAKNNIQTNYSLIFIEDCASESEELLLMSACSAHIIANSTFSWWGAWLSDSNNLVVSPSSWFTDGRNTYDFIPHRWISL